MTGVEMIAAERARQVEKCGFTAENDDTQDSSELLECAVNVADDVFAGNDVAASPTKADDWPWKRAQHIREKYKGNYIQRLAIAGALIAAEIDRLQRLEASEGEDEPLAK